MYFCVMCQGSGTRQGFLKELELINMTVASNTYVEEEVGTSKPVI